MRQWNLVGSVFYILKGYILSTRLFCSSSVREFRKHPFKIPIEKGKFFRILEEKEGGREFQVMKWEPNNIQCPLSKSNTFAALPSEHKEWYQISVQTVGRVQKLYGELLNLSVG